MSKTVYVVVTQVDVSEGMEIQDCGVFNELSDAKLHAETQIGNYLKEFDLDEAIKLNENNTNDPTEKYWAESNDGTFVVLVMPRRLM